MANINKKDVVVVGGGAAGLLCAGYAARRGKSVVVIEKMERPGRKILITGKGRCNVTNNCDRDTFLAAVTSNPRFLYSAYDAFDAQKTMAFFENHGVPLKTERGNRVFPRSDRAGDVKDALVRFVTDSGTKIINGTCARLLQENGTVTGVVLDNGDIWHGNSVVLATGGSSYPLTGSTGDGYRMAQEAGHAITDLRASLVPIVAEEKFCRDMMGLSLKNVTLTLRQRGKKNPIFSELGEMLFTHFGLSGPMVLSASAHMSGPIKDYTLHVDLKPGLTPEQLDARILRDFAAASNRDFINILGALLPRKMVPIVVQLSGIPGSAKVHQITKEQRVGLAALLKNFVITPKGFRPIEEAVITAGGVKVAEVNPKTMESKVAPGLFLAGEVLDVDAYTGGFNLQIAFSTAYLAAMNV